MTRETRANLIFLVAFLAISIPGVILLVRRKMDPTSRPMWIPDSVKQHMVYIDPTDAPATISRMMPALTAAWVADEARARFSDGPVPMSTLPTGKSAPIMSDQRLAQLIGFSQSQDRTRIGLLLWNVPRGSGDVRAFVALKSFPDEPLLAQVSMTPLPADVKRDIQDSGFPAPPQQVIWVNTESPQTSLPIELLIRIEMNGRTISDTLTIVDR